MTLRHLFQRPVRLRSRFAIYGALIASLLVLTLTLVSYLTARRILDTWVEHDLKEVAGSVAAPLQQAFNLAAGHGTALSRKNGLVRLLADPHRSESQMQAHLAESAMPLNGDLPYVLRLLNPSGEQLASMGGDAASPSRRDTQGTTITDGRPQASIDSLHPLGAQLRLVFPVSGGPGPSVLGALVMEIPLARWLVAEQVHFPKASGISRIVLLLNGAAVAQHEVAPAERTLSRRVALTPALFSLQLPFEAQVDLDHAVAYRPLHALLWQHLLWGLLCIAGVGLVVRWLVGRETQRIERLARAAGSIGSGASLPDFSLDDYGQDEVGDLAQGLGRMLGRLRAEQQGLEHQVNLRTAQFQASESALNRAQAIASIGSWVLDLVSSKVSLTPEACRIFGIAVAEMITYEKFLGCIHPDDRERFDLAWDGAMQGRSFDLEHRIVVLGAVHWVRQQAGLNLDVEGLPVSAIGTVEDITARHRVETQLRQLSTAIEQSPASIVMTDLQGNITYVNPQFERSTGYGVEEVLGKNPRVLKSARKLPFEYSAMWATLSSGQVWRGEFENVRKDGSHFFELASISPITESDGAVTGYVAVKEDITARKQIEREVAAREAKLGALVDSLPDLMFLIGADRRFAEVHAPEHKVLPQRPAKYIGQPLDAMLPGDVVVHLNAILDDVEAHGATRQFDFRLATRFGVREFIASINPLRDPEGGTDGYIVIARDETERMAVEAALVESESYNKALFSRSRIPLVILAPESATHIDCNSAAVSLFGRDSRDDLIGKSPLGFSATLQYDGTPSPAALQKHVERALSEGADIFDWRFERRVSGGSEAWDGEVYLMRIQHGGRVLLQASLDDITERRRVEARMREAVVVFNASGQGIVTTDARGVITTVNPAFCRITGYSRDEVIGHRSSMFKSGRHDEAFYQAMWTSLNSDGFWEGEIWNRRKSGEIYPQWLTISAVKTTAGDVSEFVSLFSDITQRKQQEEAIWRQANYDALTGLANRSLFLDRLERSLTQARRSGHRGGVLFLDLDGFKWINDTLGHDVGDELLIEVGRRLRACVREQDTVARLGGDEFTMVLHDLGGADDLQLIGEKTVEVLREPFSLNGVLHHLSGSVGLTVFPDDGDDVQTLLKNADIAMYQSKQTGKNRFSFYARHMQEGAQTRMRIESELRSALSEQQFVLHYQPVVDADSGELIGAEALVRWHHPSRGLLLPGEFITVAEDSGLITPIGQWVLNEAIRQLKFWHNAGHRTLHMAINVSSVQFHQTEFPDRVAQVIDAHRVDASCVLLEITESVLMDNNDATQSCMARIKAQGVAYALDDFGTGYSSLSYLKRFPVDVVKIDRSFVKDSLDDRSSAHLIEAIINMAHSLELKVTAEGVETPAQCLLLRDLGCDFLQGYLISQAVPADEFDRLFDRDALLPIDHPERAGERRLLAALRSEALDVDSWVEQLLGERSAELAHFALRQDWQSNGLDLKAAIRSHLEWRKRLTRYVAARSDVEYMDAAHVASVAHCELGGWVDGQRSGENSCLDKLDQHHREFHRLAGIIVSDYNDGAHGSARRALAGLRFREASRNVVVSLIDCFEATNKESAA